MTFTLFLCRQYGLPEEKRGEEGEERDRQHTALPGFQVCFTDQTATHTHTHTYACPQACAHKERETDRDIHFTWLYSRCRRYASHCGPFIPWKELVPESFLIVQCIHKAYPDKFNQDMIWKEHDDHVHTLYHASALL